jgi:hypothetical protein
MGSRSRRPLGLTVTLGLMACITIGCAAPTAPSGTASAKPMTVPATPEGKDAHERLFAAADADDVDAFKAVLTARSVALLDEYFAAVRTYEKDPAAPVHGWPELVASHKALSAAARARAPYPIAKEAGQWKLDLAERPESQLFRDVVSASKAPSGT